MIRLAPAVSLVARLKHSQSYEVLVCPGAQQVGGRPHTHTPALMGTTCEGWLNREALMVLAHLLDASMVGVEWSSGSGTVWLLRRVLKLFSVEHVGEWLASIEKVVEKELPELRPRWAPRHAPAVNAAGVDEDHAGANNWDDYAAYPRTHLLKQILPRPGFDFISDDGRSRVACLNEALKPGMLRPDYGVLILDNAERPVYNHATTKVPPHWLAVSFANHIDETVLWMSCPTVDDPLCARAKKEIDVALKEYARSSIGGQYDTDSGGGQRQSGMKSVPMDIDQ